MTEFAYYNSEKLDFPLHESIKIVDDPKKVNETFMISNSKELKAKMYAPEIDFYIKNSKDPLPKKIQTVLTLYEIRGIMFDYATDFEMEKDIGKTLLIVGTKDQIESIEPLVKDDFELFFAESDAVKKIEGTIGELKVHLFRNGKTTVLSVDQMIWFDAKDFAFLQNGVYDPKKDGFEEAVKRVKSNIEHFTYKSAVSYNPDICQYKGREGDICGDCADICPTNAIIKIDEKKELSFSDVDCETCGGCVSVCPSGALDLKASPRGYIYEASTLLKGKIILVVPRVMRLDDLEVSLPEDVVPFVVGGRKFLHEAHFLTLFQHSGHQVVFYSDFFSKGTLSSLDMVNELGKRGYSCDMVLTAKDKSELQDRLDSIKKVENSRYSIDELSLKKREIFAARASYIVGDRDLGVYENKNEYVHYGKVVINEKNCTLCLSCVGACNVAALTAHPEDNSLRFNASICTDCGYCEIVCPEKDCLEVVRDRFEFKPESFRQVVLAKDELFKCVECGREFAPRKAVLKIAEQLTPVFNGDELKIRTLYCCETCKARLMLKAQIGDI
ncbi:MAG: 4Fe-4S dicluster domain-containing protein [Epsilonproteobacteria bacterium]|nr:4Fe-4S dicluster domain-containing protein [Campylobacterota bacterium]